MTNNAIYNFIEFIQEHKVLTLTVIGTFASWRFLVVLYDKIYDPIADNILDANITDQYYTKICDKYIPIGIISKEFLKWFMMILLLMLIYNVLQN